MPSDDLGGAPGREERLDTLYELREELQTVAATDGPFAKFAQAGLDRLREAGYDV